MDKLSQLLKQVSKIVRDEKILQEEKRKRGENFNIFGVLGLSRSEVRLHSAFLAELLNSNGAHGLGAKFLTAFVEDVVPQKTEFEFDVNSAKVEVEYYIGAISEDRESGGRIDIYIQDKNKQTIIIENKIDAVDQYRQVSRYNKYAKDELKLTDKQVRLMYLTLYGDVPSPESLGKDKFDYICISYREDILNWLKKCLALSSLYPIVRETIRQYIITLKQLTHQDIEDQNKLLELMTSNIDAVTAILNVQETYKNHVYQTCVKIKLREFGQQHGMEFNDENLNPSAKTGPKGFYFRKDEWKTTAIWIYSESSGSGEQFRVGISSINGGKMNEGKKLDYFTETTDKDWPYGWKPLEKFSQWEWETYKAMVEGTYVEYIEKLVKEIMKEIEDKNISLP